MKIIQSLEVNNKNISDNYYYNLPWLKNLIDPIQIYNQFYNMYGYTLENGETPHANFNVGQCGYLITLPDTLEWGQTILEDFLSIQFTKIRLFIIKAGEILDLHKDTIGQTNKVREWAINVPIKNCNEGYNQWFDEKDNNELISIYNQKNSAITPKNKNNWQISCQTKLDCPKLLRVGKFHACDNSQNPNNRYVLSFRSDTINSWNKIIELCTIHC